jgi:putative transposon-encoded protein
MCSYIVATMKKAVQMSMEGYEMLEKTAVKGGNSGRIYVPQSWIGKRVRAVLIEQ